MKIYAATKNVSYNKTTCALRMAESRLWIDHVLWTRSFIVSDVASLHDKDEVIQRLLKNQDDIGNSIKPFYGEKVGNKLATLLREHTLASQVANADKSKNKADLEKYNILWYKNADEIADFLSAANPNYSNQMLKDMLHKHLVFVTDANLLVDGIIKQFPGKFK